MIDWKTLRDRQDNKFPRIFFWGGGGRERGEEDVEKKIGVNTERRKYKENNLK